MTLIAVGSAEARPCVHLTHLPDRRYWLDDLRLRDFPRIRRLSEDPEHLREAVDAQYAAPEAATVRTRIVETHGDTDAVRLNLLLVSEFLFQRKSAAVLDVAGEHLADDEVTLNTGVAKCQHRLALAALLYWKDPQLLVAVDLWDRWHSRRRRVLGVEGHRRSNVALAGQPWAELVRVGLGQLDPGDLVELRGALPRRGGREVLLAFRKVGEWANVRVENGEVVPGREDDWTLLLFHDGGNGVDATSSDLRRATALANVIGSALFGAAVRYEPVRRPLRERDLRRLLERLTNPDDDTFRLLELVATVPQLPERPVVTVGNSGQARIERAVQELRRSMPIGYDWRSVFTVKVGFLEQYRVTLHFPPRGEDLVFTYSEVDRNKDASRAFEQLVADELGVVIKPKVLGDLPRGDRAPTRRPRRLTAEHYAGLLRPVQDEPADWMVAEIDRLAEDGLVTVTRHSVLRCGDAWQGASTGGEMLDCPGEIEMPYGQADPSRPFVQPDGSAHVCGTCGRPWHAGITMLPLFLRLRVRLDHGRAWGWVLERVRARAWVAEHAEQPGVASGLFRDRRAYLVYLPLAADPTARSLGLAATFPACWIGQPAPKGYRERGVDLAELLADDELPVTRAWRLGRDHDLVGRGEPEAPPLAAEAPPEVFRLPLRKPTTRTFTVDNSGIWLDGRQVADGRATGSRMLLAILWEAARLDDATAAGDARPAPRSRSERERERETRRPRSIRKLAALTGLSLKEQAVYTWVARLRDRLAEAFPSDVDDILVSVRPNGYRLGEGVVCVGVDLRDEVARFKARLTRDRQSVPIRDRQRAGLERRPSDRTERESAAGVDHPAARACRSSKRRWRRTQREVRGQPRRAAAPRARHRAATHGPSYRNFFYARDRWQFLGVRLARDA